MFAIVKRLLHSLLLIQTERKVGIKRSFEFHIGCVFENLEGSFIAANSRGIVGEFELSVAFVLEILSFTFHLCFTMGVLSNYKINGRK